MTTIKDRLRTQLADRRESESDNDGRLYYTPKQSGVIRAMANNLDANAETVAEEAGCHPSYVTYIMDRIKQSIIERILNNEPVPEVDWQPDESRDTEDESQEGGGMPDAFSATSSDNANQQAAGKQTTTADIEPTASESSGEIESDTMTIQTAQKVPLTLSIEIPVEQVQEAITEAFGEIDQEELIDESAEVELGAVNDSKRGMTAQPTMKQAMGLDLTDEEE